GQRLGISGSQHTGAEMAQLMTRALGLEVRYNDVPPDVYRAFGFPGADDLGNMFQFKRDFNEYFCGVRSPELARSLNPELQSFDIWLDENKHKIPIE
ncbi:MAG TPA: NmrA/HSCARG family protein, partial [Candidatus Eisenbacteria bacterium]|nr:NmrA/HSCARG family protein [Candidatus Eisenbacteria bacterium]